MFLHLLTFPSSEHINRIHYPPMRHGLKSSVWSSNFGPPARQWKIHCQNLNSNLYCALRLESAVWTTGAQSHSVWRCLKIQVESFYQKHSSKKFRQKFKLDSNNTASAANAWTYRNFQFESIETLDGSRRTRETVRKEHQAEILEHIATLSARRRALFISLIWNPKPHTLNNSINSRKANVIKWIWILFGEQVAAMRS